jgi:class 3 adenylate cyclase
MTRRSAQGRGFLFADLRGYTAFAEARGDHAAAALLGSYRSMVREAIARFDGAEIRTEGDSFYVVFPSATDAVLAGMAILDGAVRPPDGAPIRVGIGVHAGETTETEEGYVGSAVNIAARVCAVAGAGELLVTDTVRALARGQLDARFVPRGRKRLKGVTEPVAVYAVVGGEGPPVRRWSRSGVSAFLRRRLDRLALPLALAIGVLILTAGALALIGSDLIGQAQEQGASPSATVAPGPSKAAEAATSPQTAAPADAREEHEDWLRARIDQDVARLCDSADPEEAPRVDVGPNQVETLLILGGLRCDLGGGAAPDVVWYWKAPLETSRSTNASSQNAFSTIVSERNLPPGDCAVETRAWGDWQFGGNTGQLLCSSFGGPALIAWLYDGETILGIAQREDGDSARLYRWWEEQARLLRPEPTS